MWEISGRERHARLLGQVSTVFAACGRADASRRGGARPKIQVDVSPAGEPIPRARRATRRSSTLAYSSKIAEGAQSATAIGRLRFEALIFRPRRNVLQSCLPCGPHHRFEIAVAGIEADHAPCPRRNGKRTGGSPGRLAAINTGTARPVTRWTVLMI